MVKPQSPSSNTASPGLSALAQAQPAFDLSLVTAPLRAGDICPQCGKAHLDYDGMLNLACPACGFALAGGCT